MDGASVRQMIFWEQLDVQEWQAMVLETLSHKKGCVLLGFMGNAHRAQHAVLSHLNPVLINTPYFFKISKTMLSKSRSDNVSLTCFQILTLCSIEW
jgi:hypothetical protein